MKKFRLEESLELCISYKLNYYQLLFLIYPLPNLKGHKEQVKEDVYSNYRKKKRDKNISQEQPRNAKIQLTKVTTG